MRYARVQVPSRPLYVEVPEWFKGPVCKTVIRGFESHPRLGSVAQLEEHPSEKRGCRRFDPVLSHEYYALVAELADAPGLSPGSFTGVRVRPPPSAPEPASHDCCAGAGHYLRKWRNWQTHQV